MLADATGIRPLKKKTLKMYPCAAEVLFTGEAPDIQRCWGAALALAALQR